MKQHTTTTYLTDEESLVDLKFKAPYRVIIVYRSRPSTGTRFRQQYWARIVDFDDNWVMGLGGNGGNLKDFASSARRARFICAALNFAD